MYGNVGKNTSNNNEDLINNVFSFHFIYQSSMESSIRDDDDGEMKK